MHHKSSGWYTFWRTCRTNLYIVRDDDDDDDDDDDEDNDSLFKYINHSLYITGQNFKNLIVLQRKYF